MSQTRAISTPAVIAIATLVATAIAALGFAQFGGWTADGAGAAARWTARHSFLWFIAAWSASSLAKLWPGGWRTLMLRRRRAIGLGFAAAHGVHFVALLIAVNAFGSSVSAATLYGGGSTYVLVALMALTSNDWSVRTLGPRTWKLLHTIGGWAIWIVFFVSYLGRIEDKPWLGIPAVALLVGALLLRVAAWIRRRAPQTA